MDEVERPLIRNIITSTAIVFFSILTASQAQQSGQMESWTVQGVCKRLVVDNHEITAECSGLLTRSKYPDGTTMFSFSMGKSVVLFRAREASSKRWQGYKTILVVDGVAIDKTGNEPEAITKVGNASCDFAAPYIGYAYINCTASVGFKMWSATIETNGRLPVPDEEYIAPKLKRPG